VLEKLVTVSSFAMVLVTSVALAQPYPSKAITIVVPAAAGGPSDTVARIIAPALAKEVKGSIIVENTGGAGGTIGAARVARSPGDGYTLYLYHIAHSTWPALYRSLPFDVVKDFEPIGLINDVPMTLVSKKDLPAKDTAREFFVLAHAIIASEMSVRAVPRRRIEPQPSAYKVKPTAPSARSRLSSTFD